MNDSTDCPVLESAVNFQELLLELAVATPPCKLYVILIQIIWGHNYYMHLSFNLYVQHEMLLV